MQSHILILAALLTTAGQAQEPAERLLQESGLSGGLVVVVGCDDPALLAGLRASEAFTVVGLDGDPAKLAKAREYLREKKLHGPATVLSWDGKKLPFTDNLVNLVVVANGAPVQAEIERVLVPGGVMISLDQKSAIANLKWVKPVSAELDGWSHYLYDASNNAVSKDKVVAPPKGLQWWAGPYSSRSHNWVPSTVSMVSSGGRFFYLRDEGPISAMPHKVNDMNWAVRKNPMPKMPEEWSVIARDAFNGKELWRRPLDGFGHMTFEDPGWGPTLWNIWSLPLSLQRRVAATPARVFVTLAYRGGLSALDSATGKTLWEYKPKEGLVDEIIADKGRVVVRIRREIPKKREAPFNRETMENSWAKTHGPAEYDKYVESQPPEMVAAIDAETGRELWIVDAPRVGAETLCALGDAVLYYNGTEVVCREAANGKERWRKSAERYSKYGNQSYYFGTGMGFLLLWNGHAYFSGGGGTTCFDLTDGKHLWKEKIGHGMGFGHPTALRVIGGKLIAESGSRNCVEALTGQALESVFKDGPFGGTHGRCHRGVATERFVMGISFGVEFYDLATGKMVSDDRWLRSECALGYVPANGLLYHAPDPCACWLGARIRGYEAFTPQAPVLDYDHVDEAERLEKGPAYESIQQSAVSSQQQEDWPAYRHDSLRSGRAACAVPANLQVLWSANLGSHYDWRGHNIVSGLTPPVVAGDRVIVSRKDANEVVCLDAGGGQMRWRYLTPAPVTAPPTIHAGRAVFGCLDGSVYSLRADDGTLAWRFRAAPAAMMTLFEGRPGSKWPAQGSVLIMDGAVYVVAGYSSFLDGGIQFFKLDPTTGKMLAHARADGPRYPFHEQNPFVAVEEDPKWGHITRTPDGYFPNPYVDIEGHRADILVSDGTDIRMGQTRITPDLKVSSILREQVAGAAVKRRWLRPMYSFLDDTYYQRAGWHYADTYYGGGNAAGAANGGKILVFDDNHSYGAQWEWEPGGRYPNHVIGQGSRIDCDLLTTENDVVGFGALRKQKPAWTVFTPIITRAMALTGSPGGDGRILFIAGPVEPKPGDTGQLDPYRGKGPGRLWALSAKDGKTLAELELPAQSVFDGLAAADKKLFLSLTDGTVVCLGQDQKK